MTKAELISSIRVLANETSTDAGAFLADTVNLLDIMADAAEVVVLDLVEFMPERFLDYEDITLVAGTAGYTLTKEWLQIWSLNRQTTSQLPKPIPYIEIRDMMNKIYVGQTAEEPESWYLKGVQINFVPTPAAAKTAYAR